MSSLDSVAVLRARMTTLGIGDLFDNFEGLGWSTLGSFAFAAAANFSGTPADEAAFQEQIIRPLFGDAVDPRVAVIRRLHFEAYTQTVGDLHRRSSRNEDDDKPKAMAPPERKARLEEVRRHTTLDIEGDLEPSDTLVDKYSHMQEVSGVLKYLPIEEVGRRDSEIKGIKKDAFFKTDPGTGLLKFHEIGKDEYVDSSTDYLFYRTLLRRGIAMHMGHLLSIEVHDQLVKWLIKEMHRDAVPNYQKISMAQVLRADQEIFLRLAEETRGGLHRNPTTDNFALDEFVPLILREPRIIAFLSPLPLGARSAPANIGGGKRGGDRELEQLREDNKRLKTRLQFWPNDAGGNPRQMGGKGKGKGKAKGKASSSGDGKGRQSNGAIRLPQELIGLNSTVGGVKVCFDFNMSKGCPRKILVQTNDGLGSCEKGAHLCMRCESTNHGASSARCSKRV
jgi:hypothetical protein